MQIDVSPDTIRFRLHVISVVSLIKVYCFKIDTHTSFPLAKALALLPIAMKSEVMKYRNIKDQVRSLVGKLMLRKALTEEGHSPQDLEDIQKDQFKRPYLNSEIDFNISHSESYVVLAIANTGKVGIDVEKIRPVDPERFRFWQNQHDAPNTSDEDRLHFFFKVWTKKEAVTKAVGRGIQIPFSEITIEHYLAKYQGEFWYLYPIDLDKEYESHVASSDRREIQISKLELKELIPQERP